MQIIDKYLKHFGIERPDTMTANEKAELERWQQVFENEVTISSVSDFMRSEIARLQRVLIDSVTAGEDRQSLFITAKIENYQRLMAVIRQPDLEKESLEADLEALIINDTNKN